MKKLSKTLALSLSVLAVLAAGGCGADVGAADEPAEALTQRVETESAPQCDLSARVTLEAGPIWSDGDAPAKCAATCGASLRWTGVWRTTVAGRMSVCECEPLPPFTREAGPIWSDADAQVKCPGVCGTETPWNGQWWTTVWGAMSVCQCQAPPPAKIATEAGPIWSRADAPAKCARACTSARREWTGAWWTTVPGRMSVCECACEP